MEKLVIVGGGIAGLSCLNALLDQGVSPLLLEGATIGTPKMCGEFLAPQAVTLLENWDLGPVEAIHQAHFFSNKKKLDLVFSKPAGASSRSEVELLLAKRARKLAGRIRENALIQKIIPGTKAAPYVFYLSSGEQLEADTVIFATGKYGQHKMPLKTFPYFGIKMHFPHIVKSNTLLMYSGKGAYFGIVPISDKLSNCACLVRKEAIEQEGSCKEFFFRLVETNLALKEVFENIDRSQMDWFESPAPEFQAKEIPEWPRAFWIGDALAGLHPAIGSGFSHGISSALMAADFYLQKNPSGYLYLARQLLKSKVFIGKLMHQIMLNPSLASTVFPLLQLNPWLLNRYLKKLGYRAG